MDDLDVRIELRCQSLRTSSSTSRPPARKTSPALQSAPSSTGDAVRVCRGRQFDKTWRAAPGGVPQAARRAAPQAFAPVECADDGLGLTSSVGFRRPGRPGVWCAWAGIFLAIPVVAVVSVSGPDILAGRVTTGAAGTDPPSRPPHHSCGDGPAPAGGCVGRPVRSTR
jgi:hypothetical protein